MGKEIRKTVKRKPKASNIELNIGLEDNQGEVNIQMDDTTLKINADNEIIVKLDGVELPATQQLMLDNSKSKGIAISYETANKRRNNKKSIAGKDDDLEERIVVNIGKSENSRKNTRRKKLDSEIMNKNDEHEKIADIKESEVKQENNVDIDTEGPLKRSPNNKIKSKISKASTEQAVNPPISTRVTRSKKQEIVTEAENKPVTKRTKRN